MQKMAASFVLDKYCSKDDTVRLDWLPIKERREFNYLKIAIKVIHNKDWPDINKLYIRSTGRMLRCSTELKPTEKRNSENISSFCSALRNYLLKRTKEELPSSS